MISFGTGLAARDGAARRGSAMAAMLKALKSARGQHGAALDVVDRLGQAVDADHLGASAGRGQRLERAERHHVVGGPHAVDLRDARPAARAIAALRRRALEVADPRVQQLDRRVLGHGPAQAVGAVAGGRALGVPSRATMRPLPPRPVDQRLGDALWPTRRRRSRRRSRRAVHAVDADRDRDAGGGEARRDPRTIACRRSASNTTPAGHGGQRLADQRLLLADIVGRLGHIVHRPGAGLGGDPVGGQAGRVIGGIEPVLGENGEGGGGPWSYFSRPAAL